MVIVRGGGDIATGIVQKLWRSGFPTVILETKNPSAIRRTVTLSSAVSLGKATVEDVPAILAEDSKACYKLLQEGVVPVLVDPDASSLIHLQPAILVDAILAKRNLGTRHDMAPLTVGVGPGFEAPTDVDAVVETMRGHSLGQVILQGCALANTGVPGEFAGKSKERVIHAPCAGTLLHEKKIGDFVLQGETLFTIHGHPVPSPLTGVLRGLISDGYAVHKGLKVADVDPRTEQEVDCYSISDKARCIGGAVLEACLWLGRKKDILHTAFCIEESKST